ncbi:hypothetical protein PLICRDRAFT_136034 [Plicaturopsis crispa FD-325 SS-3]|nr:hypothetical protein PLICRDRAFT_136034 [Plicaturopsis crispa FD-325 SS-3]
MEDELGIVYLIENAQQFWSEIDDILLIPDSSSTTLARLDSSLKRFLSVCASYHEQYLQSPFQLEHACELLLDSELFAFHSERMCEILSDEAQSNTDPHTQFILYNVLLHHGRRHSSFFRSNKRWQPLVPLLMDHILVEIDPEVEDTYFGIGSAPSGAGGTSMAAIPVPIEAKMRSLAVRLVYEVCRVQKLSVQDLRIFDDAFLDSLFDLVEQTRNMQDESFNYSVIKLIVALNEQFMVASLSGGSSTPLPDATATPVEGKNRVLNVLMRRLGSSKTFGENMIFMLNRADRTPEDLCMQLLVLKILYLLFTTKGAAEYFYTNDLCVLVDVFLRELVDLDEDSESLRHTYLRVLHPLLTKTQLRDVPYKRAQIVRSLESLVENAEIREVNPATRRLVERCLSGDWCVQFRNVKIDAVREVDALRVNSPSNDSVAIATQGTAPQPMTASLYVEQASSNGKVKTLKPTRSVNDFKISAPPKRAPPSRTLEVPRRASNDSSASINGVASATAPHSTTHRRRVSKSDLDATIAIPLPQQPHAHHHHGESGSHHLHAHASPSRADSLDTAIVDVHRHHGHSHVHTAPVASSLPPSPTPGAVAKPRRSAPPAPPKRRKPPAVPTGRTNSGATITTIASSAGPLSKAGAV